MDDDSSSEQVRASPDREAQPLGEAFLSLCNRFGLQPWATARDGHGLWAFGAALTSWLQQPESERSTGSELQLESIRLVTTLLIIVGAVIRPASGRPTSACKQALDAVAAARRTIASQMGPVASFPRTARVMERLVRVRGWRKLTVAEQTLAEALLDLYLETLAATIKEAGAEILLATSEAWLTILHTQALPVGFDERLLRATSWYLDSYVSSRAR
ncbi:MAG TPA: hypothetical protein VK821_06200 [Dehalococcoidia bacterium]|nr:hypothetical protein [Dehalococcoidia bacterium]